LLVANATFRLAPLCHSFGAENNRQRMRTMGIFEKVAETELRASNGETPITAGRRRLSPDAAIWLRRGERLGDALLWMARTIAALSKGASASLRHISGRFTTPPTGEPG
jgi:hypothetical protein